MSFEWREKSRWRFVTPMKLVITVNALYIGIIAVAVWNIDIAFGAVIGGSFMTNGFEIWSPTQAYHSWLYCLMLFSILLFAENMWLLFRRGKV